MTSEADHKRCGSAILIDSHAGGIQQPCADDADAACGEEPEGCSQQPAQGE